MAAAFLARFYLELHRTGDARDAAQTSAALSLGPSCSCLSSRPTRSSSWRRATFVRTRRVSALPRATRWPTRRPRRYTRSSTSKRRRRSSELFADVPVALANSVQIAKRCNWCWNSVQPRLPEFPTPEGVTLDDHCRALAWRGARAAADEALRRTRQVAQHAGGPSTPCGSISS